MGLLVAAAPFLAFALCDNALGSAHAVMVGALVSFILVAREALKTHRSFKILEVGTLILFVALSIYLTVNKSLSIIAVRLCLDAGLLVIVLSSLALRRPFTMQYASERVSAEYARSREFLHRNDVMTGAWALAFAVLVVAEAALLFDPSIPKAISTGALIGAPVSALLFSLWYSKRAQRRASQMR